MIEIKYVDIESKEIVMSTLESKTFEILIKHKLNILIHGNMYEFIDVNFDAINGFYIVQIEKMEDEAHE